MKIAVYSYHEFEKPFMDKANAGKHELCLIPHKLSSKTIGQAEGCPAIVLFSSDKANENVLRQLKEMEVKFIVTRSAGTDHIDVKAAEELGLQVAHVPSYSPHAIAEHTFALVLALYRKLKPSLSRTASYNFSLNGLVGAEISKKIFGICGTGDIGKVVAKIAHGFGAKVVLFDAEEDGALTKADWATYTTKKELLRRSDIISLHLPLNEGTQNFISEEDLAIMKDTAILINTGRGGLVDTHAVYQALLAGRLAGYGMDVYEGEKGVFYKDLSDGKTKDPLLVSLIAMDNVIVTAHQAFLTNNALHNMMATVFDNLHNFEKGNALDHLVKP